MTKINRIVFLFLLLLISSCSQAAAPTQKVSDQELAAQATKTLLPANGAVVGRVVSKTQGGKPLADIAVRLAQIYYNADKSASNWVLEGASSPSAGTDANGYFSINNVAAHDYVLIVGDIEGQYVVMTQADGKHAIVYTITAGKVLDVQTLEAGLPFVK